MPGKLYLCATPIGNLEDITLRVLKTLENADLIAAEDTRNSLHLLNHFDIKKPLTSYHEHNKYEKAEYLLERLKAGENIALITDAGTPAISDPGEVLVKRCIEEGLEVTSLPGACACVTALTISGLSTASFCFEAFLPFEKKDRSERLERLKKEERTIIIYEAPHRLKRTLGELRECLGEKRRISLCRELTKKYEEVTRMTLGETEAYYDEKEPRGEYVLVIEGKSREEIEEESRSFWEHMDEAAHVAWYESKGNDRKTAMKLAAKDRGVARRDIYAKLLDKE